MDTSKKYLNEYYFSLQKVCLKTAWDIKNKFENSTIHNFRVAIKKMNAFRSFINFIEPNFEIKDNRLEEIYKAAGKLRTSALLKKEFKSIEIYNNSWKMYFRNRIKNEKTNYLKIFYNFKKEKKKEFKSEISRVSYILGEKHDLENSAKAYIKSLYDKINSSCTANEKDKSSLHEFRKLMKETGYNYLLISEAFYLPIDETLTKEIDKFNKVLGKWHDKVVFKKFILKQKNFEGSDRLAEQIGIDVQKSEANILIEIEKFRLNYLRN